MKRLSLSLLFILFLCLGYSWAQDTGRYSRKPVSSSTKERPEPQGAVQGLLKASADLKVVELPSQAIPLWRPFRDQCPTLALLSSDPFLMAIPTGIVPQVEALVEQGKPEDFHARARRQVADPLLLPQQTLSAALGSGFFGKILWVLPPAEKGQEFSLKVFRGQLTDSGILSDEEAAGLSLEQGVFRGTLRGIPFQAAPIGALPQLEGPVVLHLDLSFFAAQYRNEVATPLFSLLHGTLLALRQAGWPVLLTTLSISTEEGEVPLELRFLKNALAETFVRPGLLDAPLPEAWALRKEARYLETFFQPEAIVENYLQMEALRPEDASTKFDIYRAFIMLKEKEEALARLDEAVRLDRGYGREYLDLAMAATEKGRLTEAFDYLGKARKALPLNPFVTIETVNVLLELGERQKAQALLTEMEKTSWSPVYYAELPEIIADLSRQAKAKK